MGGGPVRGARVRGQAVRGIADHRRSQAEQLRLIADDVQVHPVLHRLRLGNGVDPDQRPWPAGSSIGTGQSSGRGQLGRSPASQCRPRGQLADGDACPSPSGSARRPGPFGRLVHVSQAASAETPYLAFGVTRPSLLSAERRLVLLSGRLVCLVDEGRGLCERGGAGPGREVAVEPALPDAPLRPLRQQAQRRVSVVGEVAVRLAAAVPAVLAGLA